MDIIDLKKEDHVFILTMRSGQNLFNRMFVDAMNEALDSVEGSSGPAAMVTTGGEDKFSPMVWIWPGSVETVKRKRWK